MRRHDRPLLQLGMLIAGLWLAGTLGVATPALAGPARADARLYGRGHGALEVQLGGGAPLGYAGLAVSADLLPQIAVELGSGWGRSGLQGGALVRFRRVTGPWAAGLGIGSSVGDYRDTWHELDVFTGLSTDKQHSASWHPAWWANVEGFTEWRDGSGFRVRGGAGFGWLLNRGSCVGADVTFCESMPTVGTFYATVALGYGF